MIHIVKRSDDLNQYQEVEVEVGSKAVKHKGEEKKDGFLPRCSWCPIRLHTQSMSS
jgi:hypothetical protein